LIKRYEMGEKIVTHIGMFLGYAHRVASADDNFQVLYGLLDRELCCRGFNGQKRGKRGEPW
jgi:hypothetical protein